MKAAAMGLAGLLGMAGCTNTTDPVLVQEVCIRSHTETVLSMVAVPASCGQNCTTVRMQPIVVPHEVCDQAIKVVRPNPRYQEAR